MTLVVNDVHSALDMFGNHWCWNPWETAWPGAALPPHDCSYVQSIPSRLYLALFFLEARTKDSSTARAAGTALRRDL